MSLFNFKAKRQAKEKEAAQNQKRRDIEAQAEAQKQKRLRAEAQMQREKEQEEKEMADQKAFQENPDTVFDDDDNTALQRAISDEDFDEVKRVLSCGANPNFFGESYSSNIGRAMDASSENNIALVKLLLQKGADPNLKSKEEDTCLYKAIYGSCSNSYDMAEVLLEAGAEVNLLDYDQESIVGRAYNESEEKFSLVMKHGGDIFQLSNKSDPVWKSVIYRENRKQFDTMVRYTKQKMRLLSEFNTYAKENWSKGSSTEQNLRNIFWHAAMTAENIFENPKAGQSFFHDMVEQENLDHIHTILNQHAYQDTANHKGQTPLHLASIKNNVPLIAVLLKKGADVKAQDASGFTALDVLANCGHLGGYAEQVLKDHECQFNVLKPERIAKESKPSNSNLPLKGALKTNLKSSV